jgi:hypothetical protein
MSAECRHTTSRIVVASLVLAGVAYVCRGAEPVEPAAPARDRPVFSPQAEEGKLAYDAKCGRCHGDALEGKEHAPPLKGAGFRTQWEHKMARALYRRVLSTMPLDSPGTLSEKETISIVVYCLTLNGVPVGSEPLASAAALNDIEIAFGGE